MLPPRADFPRMVFSLVWVSLLVFASVNARAVELTETEARFRADLQIILSPLRDGLPPQDHGLEALARSYAQELARRGVLSHEDPQGFHVKQRWLRAGGRPGSLGEILGAASDPRLLAQAWLNSPKHRRILLDRRWSFVGIGVAAAEGTFVAVVLFLGP